MLAMRFSGKSSALRLPLAHTRGSSGLSLETARAAIFTSGVGVRTLNQMAGSFMPDAAVGQAYAYARINASRTALKDPSSWVPARMLAEGFAPDALSTLGRPLILMASAGACLAVPEVWKAFGIGQFLFGHEGKSVVLLWPGRALAEVSVDICRITEQLSDLPSKDIDGLVAGAGMCQCTLTARTAIWVPYGWVPMVIPDPQGKPVTLATLPFYSAEMCLRAVAGMDLILEGLQKLRAVVASEEQGKDIDMVILWLQTALEAPSSEEEVPPPPPVQAARRPGKSAASDARPSAIRSVKRRRRGTVSPGATPRASPGRSRASTRAVAPAASPEVVPESAASAVSAAHGRDPQSEDMTS